MADPAVFDSTVFDPAILQDYLHRHIPLSTAMGVTVLACSVDGVTLRAPLAPNINHQSTVFGGSASAVAILAAWSLVHVRLSASGAAGNIVIRANTMHYEQPLAGDFEARATLPEESSWERCLQAVRRRRMARITVPAILLCGGARMGALEGEFVVLPA